MIKNPLLLVFTVLTLTNCGSGPSISNLLNASAKIQKELGAKSCNITYNSTVDSDHGSNRSVTINIEGLSNDYKNIDKEKPISIAALLFAQNSDSSTLNSLNTVDVDLTVDGNRTVSSFSLFKLNTILSYINTINLFFDMEKKNDYSGFSEFADVKYMTDSGIAVIKSGLMSLDSLGKLDRILITGFADRHILETQDEVTVIWADAYNGKFYANYTFIFMNATGKLIHIGINEPEK